MDSVPMVSEVQDQVQNDLDKKIHSVMIIIVFVLSFLILLKFTWLQYKNIFLDGITYDEYQWATTCTRFYFVGIPTSIIGSFYAFCTKNRNGWTGSAFGFLLSVSLFLCIYIVMNFLLFGTT